MKLKFVWVWLAIICCGAVSLLESECRANETSSANLQTISKWREGLQSPDNAKHYEAAIRLLELGVDAKEAYPDLIQVLMDNETLDAKIASKILYANDRQVDDPSRLINSLALDTKACVPAAWELSQLGLAATDEVRSALLDALRNPDKHERNFLVVALATTCWRNEDAAKALLQVLQDEGSADSQQLNYKYPQAAAAIALGMIESRPNEVIPALTRNLDQKNNWEIQRGADCFALGRFGSNAKSALPLLESIYANEKSILRDHAGRAIAAIKVGTTSSSTQVSAESIQDISAIVERLKKAKNRVDPTLVKGVRALGTFAARSMPLKKKGSRKSAPPIHESITLALGYLDARLSLPNPEEIAQQEKTSGLNEDSRLTIMALGGVQQGIAATLLWAWHDSQTDERIMAVRQLAPMGTAARSALPLLKELVHDDDWLVRRAAYLAPGR